MTLEKQGHNQGYTRPDIDGKCPNNEICVENCPEVLETNLDLKAIKSKLEK